MLLTEPLLEVTRNRLRDKLKNIAVPRTSIRITNEERVPPEAGEEFINLFAATSTNEYPSNHTQRKERYSFSVGITRRFSNLTINTTAEGIYTYDAELISRTKSSMARRAYEIIGWIDGSWAIPNAIEDLPEYENLHFCITSPIGYAGSDQLQEVTANHFYTEDEVEEQPVGLFLRLHFTGLETYYDKY